ncbi:amino acid adenylation domain-containing protein [Brucella pseudogrignonensis]|uniref:amino acid adenylation domain-containing protein n=1 Tax=Brucella pseudogrignonensis TaxID=419475 RepID=UPI0038B44E92
MSISHAISILEQLRAAGTEISLDGEELVVRGNVTPELAAQIRSGKQDIIAFLTSLGSGEAKAAKSIAVDPACRHEPFPLNETQQAYWLGRDAVFESGEVAIHVFIEMGGEELDFPRLEAAWRLLVGHHDMLRAIVLPDGQQQILQHPPEWKMPVHDLRQSSAEAATAHVGKTREELAHYCADLSRWPSWRVEGFHLPDGENLLMISLDCWSIDGRSIQILAADLAALYRDLNTQLPVTDLTFRDYVLGLEAEQETSAYGQSLSYWQERVKVLPPAPRLPRQKNAQAGKARFVRHHRTHPQAVYTTLKRQAAKYGLTVANVLIACYAQVLGRWSDASRFTLNIPRWNRHALHEDVDQIVGEFATFELLEVELRQGESFAAFAKRLQMQFAEDLNHDMVSGVRILREWRKHNGADPGVAMPFVFTHEPDLFGEGRARAYMASFSDIAPVKTALTQTPQVWIDAQYHDVNGELFLVWDALDALFAEGAIDAMFEVYADLIEELGTDEQRWTKDDFSISLPVEQEKTRILFNDTEQQFSRSLFRDRLAAHAENTPGALAVADKYGVINWAGLKRRVDALAERLSIAGLGHRMPVAIAMEKGAEQVIAALALHTVGAVCVPLDPDIPAERFAYMTKHCKAAAILTTPAMADLVQDKMSVDALPVLFVGREDAAPVSGAIRLPELTDEDLHCILYTSGSTGLPKAVMVPLGALLNVVADGLPRFDVSAQTRFFSLTPMHHDLSLYDIYAATYAGGAVILPDPTGRRDPAHWISMIRDHGVTAWNTVPAMMTMLLDYCEGNGSQPIDQTGREAMQGLRTVILGGDWIPVETTRRLKMLAPSALLTSIGGPTETTIWNITNPVGDVPEGWDSIPYGTPTANNRYYILNDRLEDCPDWVSGEMYCAGKGVTAGYYADEERTNAAFMLHPRTGERLYRTGDRGCFRPEGIIEFLGRQDNQVNLNGYRMELGELETALGRHPKVAQAVAIPVRQGNIVRSIVVWATLLPGENAGTDELMDFIKAALPRQMHPSAIRLRTELPLTANGKVDRKRLEREIDAVKDAVQEFEPADELQAEVAAAWEAVLGAPPGNADTSFFAAGGDSISAIRLYNRLLAGRVEGANVLTVFRASTVRALSQLLKDSAGAAKPSSALPPVAKTPRDDIAYPATAAQSRLWFEERVIGGGSLYNLCFNVALEGPVDAAALQGAFQNIIADWEILRIAIREGDDGEPVQILRAPWPFKLERTDLRAVVDKDARLREIGLAEAEKPFVLADGRPIRAHLVVKSGQSANLVITVHHAAFDGWTFGHFLQTLASVLQGKAVDAPEISSIDYARWERLPAVREKVARQTAWWEKQLAGNPPAAELSSGKIRATIRDAEGSISTRILPADIARKIASLARTAGTTPFVTLLTALGVVLGRLSREETVLLGTHISLRDQPSLETMPGMMVNNIGLKLYAGQNAGFETLLQAARKTFMDGWENGLAPFNHVVRALGNWHDTTRHPLYNITFTHENLSNDVLDAGTFTLSHAEPFVVRSPLDIDLAMSDLPDGGISLKAVFNARLFDDANVSALLEAVEAVLASAGQNPTMPLNEITLSLLPLESLLERGEGTRVPFPDRTALELFDHQVKANPDRPALLDQQGSALLTFGMLGVLSEDVAAHFYAEGVRPGDTVAICLPRGGHMIAAMLATWRCGAHFAAISAGQAEGRIIAILKDAKPALIVTSRPDIVSVTKISRPESWTVTGKPAPSAVPDKIAALIYTSGSTGRPNGVEFTMEAMLNRLHWQWEEYPFQQQEKCIARTAVDFVDYLAEIFAPLLAGHPVAVLSDETASDPEALSLAISLVQPKRLLTIPSLIAVLLEERETAMAHLSGVELWVASGEPLTGTVADKLYGLFPNAALINMYGSSETGADVTAAQVDRETRSVSIGKPIANLGAHILDSSGQPLPAGLPGDIYVSGAGLAQGYRNRPDLDRQRFSIWQNRRVFRTGDRGVRRTDGGIELLGRTDRQIKIRGQRIELGEIQSVMAALEGVDSAAVVFDKTGNRPQIIAAFTGEAIGSVIISELKRLLPAASVPAVCKRLEKLPVTSGGKIAYPAIAGLVRAEQANEEQDRPLPPVTDTEKRLASLWDEVLGISPASRTTMFHDVGGHSLAAARLAARIKRAFQIEFPIRLVIERNSLGDMAASIDSLLVQAAASPDEADLEEFVF